MSDRQRCMKEKKQMEKQTKQQLPSYKTSCLRKPNSMKRITPLLLGTLITLLFAVNLNAANFKDLPAKIIQPDGTIIHCLASGDEFFNYLHDADGYTIIKGQDGWYYYAVKDASLKVVPSQYTVGVANPATAGIPKYVKISEAEYKAKRSKYLAPFTNPAFGGPVNHKAPPLGSFNNPVVYIRFADDPEFTEVRQTYIDLFTGTGGATYSVNEYYEAVSYNQLSIDAEHFPTCLPTTNISFQDSHDRGYFQPYNATTNPDGYETDTESRLREHQLLVDAINYVKAQIEATYTAGEIDMDNDGYVDNMTFIVYGDNDEWSDLLWAHRWALYTYNITIHGKRVWDYNFQPESQCSARTTCHELFHCIGAPDLYHYTDNGVSPAYYWDIMEYGSGSMTAYMKEAVGGWITIPEITSSGTYTLNPLASSTNNAFMIALPNSPTEYIVVEFRKKTGPVESKIISSCDEGLLIYRINTAVSIDDGNADGPPDMLWVYRPNGDTNNDGDPWNATFSSTQSRTTFNATSNPACLLSDDATWGGISISNVGAVGTTISFDVTMPSSGYNITFNVSDGSGAVSGADVDIDGDIETTNAGGVAVYTGMADGTYSYTVSKSGYQDATGTVTVSGGNATKNVTLTLSVPVTKLRDDFCNSSQTTTNVFIYCDGISGATDYEFNFVNSGTGFNQTKATSAVWGAAYGYRNYLRLYNIPGIQYGLTYNVKVRAKKNGVWGNWGTVCTLTLGGTKLRSDFCNVTIPNSNTFIYCDAISGTTNYEFRFTNTTTFAQTSRTTQSVWGASYGYRNYLRMYYIPGLAYGSTYNVDVRAYINGTWTSYGQICQIVYGPLTKDMMMETSLEPVLYPNPFSNNVSLTIEGIPGIPCTVSVYDISGRSMGVAEVISGEEFTFGEEYQPGLYLVNIISGSFSETIRVIKTN